MDYMYRYMDDYKGRFLHCLQTRGNLKATTWVILVKGPFQLPLLIVMSVTGRRNDLSYYCQNMGSVCVFRGYGVPRL